MSKLFFRTSVIVALLCFTVMEVESQCMAFAKSVCKVKLAPFIHDGNYNAVIMSEGESAELIKTFFSGQKYRITVCKVDKLPPVRFWITDSRDRVLFDNSTQNYVDTWDFELEKTQMLSLNIRINDQSPESETIISGCVAVLFGIEDK